jgi:hypothetical protein
MRFWECTENTNIIYALDNARLRYTSLNEECFLRKWKKITGVVIMQMLEV